MNLKSLAIALGMSKTTVSRALNGYPEVNSRTREIVLAAAKKVGYRPNPLARSLAVGRTNVLGMIYPLLPSDLGDSVFLSVVNGMSDYESGLSLCREWPHAHRRAVRLF